MIERAEFAKRRKLLMQQMGPMSLAIIPAAREKVRSLDVQYPFRQQNDFYYLTGFPESHAILVLTPKHHKGEYTLFCLPPDPDIEVWEGPRIGQKGALEKYDADLSFPIVEFESTLPLYLKDIETIYYSLGMDKALDQQLIGIINMLRNSIRSGAQPPIHFIDIAPLIHEMRLIKNKNEIRLIQRAVDISVEAHMNVMRACRPQLFEYELEAQFISTCIKNGARFQAYPPIIGAGKNTCVLHYHTNNQLIKDGDLVLIDAGAEFENYASDITRTFPANGRFSKEQAEIYDLVLSAQLAAIQHIKPNMYWHQAQMIIVKIFIQGLVDLGILKGNVEKLIEQNAYLPFYMHNSGHWLGLDVHDVGIYKINQKWRKLVPGMVITIEPGLYLSPHIKGLAKRWHNIGIRIEDDVLVTEAGCKVLSQDLPKTRTDIESLMRT